MKETSKENLLRTLSSKKYVHLKAVDDATGELIGHVGLASAGIDSHQVPWSDAGEPPKEQQVQSETKPKQPADEDHEALDDIERLKVLEDVDMKH